MSSCSSDHRLYSHDNNAATIASQASPAMQNGIRSYLFLYQSLLNFELYFLFTSVSQIGLGGSAFFDAF